MSKYVDLVEEELNGPDDQDIMELIFKNIEKNGPAIEFEVIAFKLGISPSRVERVANMNKQNILDAIGATNHEVSNFPCHNSSEGSSASKHGE